MSPRAAWRLESLGFSHVYDYVAGKIDWLAAGLTFGATIVLVRYKVGVIPTIIACGMLGMAWKLWG